jgi:ADP-ribose pyrophosphatase YjhB (NUDIX family)
VAVDTEISRTLVELERKLEELERALTSIGARRREGDGARLVDERLDAGAIAPPSSVTASPPRNFTASPPPSVTASPPPHAPTAGGRASAELDESIELSELVRFRDRLERTMRELVEDYEQVIRLRGASSSPPPAGES